MRRIIIFCKSAILTNVIIKNDNNNIDVNKHNLGGISTNILNKNTIKTWKNLDEWIEQGNEICTNSLSLVMMRTQQTNQKNDFSEKEKNKGNYDDDKSSDRGRERGSVEESNEEYFVNDKNEFQYNENFIFHDNKIVKTKNEDKNENKNGNEKKNEEKVIKNMKNLSNYFKISESELNILCKKISKSNMNNEGVSTTGGRVRAHDERGNLLRSCVFNAELSDLVECCLLNKENDIFVVATGEIIIYVF